MVPSVDADHEPFRPSRPSLMDWLQGGGRIALPIVAVLLIAWAVIAVVIGQ